MRHPEQTSTCKQVHVHGVCQMMKQYQASFETSKNMQNNQQSTTGWWLQPIWNILVKQPTMPDIEKNINWLRPPTSSWKIPSPVKRASVVELHRSQTRIECLGQGCSDLQATSRVLAIPSSGIDTLLLHRFIPLRFSKQVLELATDLWMASHKPWPISWEKEASIPCG